MPRPAWSGLPIRVIPRGTWVPISLTMTNLGLPDRPSILIIDDDPHSHRITQLALSSLGARFVAAWSGLDSITVARKELPDLIILDLGLPAGDGFSVLQRIAHMPALAQIPVIVVSAHDADRKAAAALDAGAEVYLQKPVDPQVLLDTATRLLSVASPARH